MNNYTKLLNNLETLELNKIKENLNQYIDLINEKKKDITDALYELTNLEIETKEKTTVSQSMKDIKQGFRFIIKSNRLKALFLFTSIFVGVLHIISTYEKSLLTDLQCKVVDSIIELRPDEVKAVDNYIKTTIDNVTKRSQLYLIMSFLQ